MFIFTFISSWIHYFPSEVVPSPTNYNKPSVPSFLREKTIHVLNSFFLNLTNNYYGGAIRTYGVDVLLLEETTFLNCQTTKNDGGALYFHNNMGKFAAYKTCGSSCICNHVNASYGQFYRIMTGSKEKCYVDSSSFVNSLNDFDNSNSALYFDTGDKRVINSNISCNIIQGRTIIAAGDTGALVSLSLFTNNTGNQNNCFDIWNQVCNIKQCNFIRNKNKGCILYASVKTKINAIESCFFLNIASKLADNYNNGLAYFYDCAVDNSTSFSNVATFERAKSTFVIGLSFFNTENCPANYNSILPFYKDPNQTKVNTCKANVNAKKYEYLNLVVRELFIYN